MRERVKRFLQNRGFTLIELLVVISIIGFLATASMVVFNSVRMKARDARRKADLTQIKKALDLYFDQYGYYPPSAGCGYDCNGYSFSTSGGNWIAGLQEFLPKIPVDPINNVASPWGIGNYSYSYGNVGKDNNPAQYDLTAQLENTGDPDRCGVKNYKYYFSDSPWCVAFGGGYSNQIFEISQLKSF